MAHSPDGSPTKTVLLGLGLLLSGVIIGAGLMGSILWKRLEEPSRDLRRVPAHLPARMREELNLSEDQVRQIRQIMERHWEEMEALRSELEPRFRAHLDRVDSAIKAVLTEEQRREWEERFSRERLRWAGPHGRRPPPRFGEPPPDDPRRDW